MDSYSKEMLRQQVSRMTEKNMFEFYLLAGILDNRVTAAEDQWQKGVYHRQISDRYRQISGEVFVLIFMRNSTSLLRQKMGAIKEKCRESITLLEKFTKFLMKKNAYVTLLHYPRITFFKVITFHLHFFQSISRESILLALRSAYFSLQD